MVGKRSSRGTEELRRHLQMKKGGEDLNPKEEKGEEKEKKEKRCAWGKDAFSQKGKDFEGGKKLIGGIHIRKGGILLKVRKSR